MDGTIAEICMFAGNFAPRNWSFCNGATISISQNTALFSLLGTTYGGNGQTTFQLPDLQGRVALGAGAAPGLKNYNLGERGGVEAYMLQPNQLPAHTHAATVVSNIHANENATTGDSTGAVWAQSGSEIYASGKNVAMASDAVTVSGTTAMSGGQSPIATRQPYLGFEQTNLLRCFLMKTN